MNPVSTIVCKPTSWFLFRATALLLMFGVFTVLFYVDASTGYRSKNLEFYLYQTFERATRDFSRLNAEGNLSPEAWKSHAAAQQVAFPDDPSLLPAGTRLPMPWPPILHDADRMRPLQWKMLWLEYSKSKGYDSEPSEEPYDARAITEQWVVFWICLGCSVVTLFFLVRTMFRSIKADADAVTSAAGVRVPYAELHTLDLRKWETKGLAFVDYDGASGKGRIRIDGLTYGGFNKEQGEPAERLMGLLRANFSGEILEYAPLAAEPGPADGSSSS